MSMSQECLVLSFVPQMELAGILFAVDPVFIACWVEGQVSFLLSWPIVVYAQLTYAKPPCKFSML